MLLVIAVEMTCVPPFAGGGRRRNAVRGRRAGLFDGRHHLIGKTTRLIGGDGEEMVDEGLQVREGIIEDDLYLAGLGWHDLAAAAAACSGNGVRTCSRSHIRNKRIARPRLPLSFDRHILFRTRSVRCRRSVPGCRVPIVQLDTMQVPKSGRGGKRYSTCTTQYMYSSKVAGR